MAASGGVWRRRTAAACGGGDGGATKNIISPKFSNFGDIINRLQHSTGLITTARWTLSTRQLWRTRTQSTVTPYYTHPAYWMEYPRMLERCRFRRSQHPSQRAPSARAYTPNTESYKQNIVYIYSCKNSSQKDLSLARTFQCHTILM